MLAVDLDDFKYINDSLGHSAGDELIRGWARRSAPASPHRHLARLGGDEFAVILPGPTRTTPSRADDLLEAVRNPERGAARGGRMDKCAASTCSIGVALLLGSGAHVTAEEILVEAAIAMYDGKEAGRDRAVVYDSRQDRQEGNAGGG